MKRWRKLGFPYEAEYEEGFKRQHILQIYKPVMLVTSLIFLFVMALLCLCVFWPQWLAPFEQVDTLIAVHAVFLVFTAVILVLSVLLRRKMIEKTWVHFLLCDAYALGILLWSSVLASFSYDNSILYAAIIFVSFCVAMVALLKLWQSLLIFTVNYVFFAVLLLAGFGDTLTTISQIAIAGLAAVVSIVISYTLYKFRARTYYDRITILRQVEEINTINAQLQALIHIDQLAGLYNRRYLDECLPGVLADVVREGPVCVMMLDVDHFKAFNDRYGHQAGDLCLRRIADLIRGNVGQRDHVVRYGGEEFFVLAAAESEEHMLALAEKVRRAVETDFIEHASHPLGRVTISVGLAFCSGRDGTCPDLFTLTKSADAALYSAKAGGRNRVVLAEPPEGRALSNE